MALIKPLTLGKLTLPHNLIQAPLAGVSAAPFRELAHRYGQPAYCTTEMISAKALITQPLAKQKRFLYKSEHEGKLCFQLSGTVAEHLREATKIAIDHGADLLDINCGCPQPKIRAKGAGSKLLEDPRKLFALVSAIRQTTTQPVSVKIRLSPQGHEADLLTIKAIEEAGADAIIVHGRTWRDSYETPIAPARIQALVACTQLPIIANGDIVDAQSAETLLSQTGAAGIMVARASMGQPWLFAALRAALAGQPFSPPTLSQRGDMFLFHAEGLCRLLESEKPAMLQMRKFAKYYARNTDFLQTFCQATYQLESLSALMTLVKQYFK